MLIWIIEWSFANLRILIKVLFIQNINLIRSVPKFILWIKIFHYFIDVGEGFRRGGISVKILKYFHLSWSSVNVIISDQTFWPGEQPNCHFKPSKPGDHTSSPSPPPSPPQFCLRKMFPSPWLSPPPPPSLSKRRESMPSQYYPRYAPCSMYSPLLAVIAGIST